MLQVKSDFTSYFSYCMFFPWFMEHELCMQRNIIDWIACILPKLIFAIVLEGAFQIYSFPLGNSILNIPYTTTPNDIMQMQWNKVRERSRNAFSELLLTRGRTRGRTIAIFLEDSPPPQIASITSQLRHQTLLWCGDIHQLCGLISTYQNDKT